LILPALTRRPSLVTGCHSFSSFLGPRRPRPRPRPPRPRSPPRSPPRDANPPRVAPRSAIVLICAGCCCCRQRGSLQPAAAAKFFPTASPGQCASAKPRVSASRSMSWRIYSIHHSNQLLHLHLSIHLVVAFNHCIRDLTTNLPHQRLPPSPPAPDPPDL
jgi:hypothetical protein